MKRYLLNKQGLESLYNAITGSGTLIIAPIMQHDRVVMGRPGSYAEIATEFVQTRQSAKEVVFPRFETLFTFTKDKTSVSLEDFDADSVPGQVIWGVRPCDASGFGALSAILNWDSGDKLFNTRMQKTTVLGYACTMADEYCFCTSVGGNPGSTSGSDILFTRISEERYLAEVMTEKGENLVSLVPGLFSEAPAQTGKEEHLAQVPVQFTKEAVGKKLKAFFDSEIWVKQSLRCIGCGACAFVCPACACFDIQDENHGKHGRRLRCWDSCGYALFTKHTSGHNPRENQSQRWRQRLLHKFSYMPERLDVYGCTGCGRCSRACPVDMNLLEHLVSIEDIQP